MGCIVIEHFEEEQITDTDFGKNKPAHVDVHKAQRGIISLHSISVAAFENITIHTTRPGTTANKIDQIAGVRIKTSWGDHLVVFNDQPMDFSKAMDAACSHQKINEITTKTSPYWQQFGKQ